MLLSITRVYRQPRQAIRSHSTFALRRAKGHFFRSSLPATFAHQRPSASSVQRNLSAVQPTRPAVAGPVMLNALSNRQHLPYRLRRDLRHLPDLQPGDLPQLVIRRLATLVIRPLVTPATRRPVIPARRTVDRRPAIPARHTATRLLATPAKHTASPAIRTSLHAEISTDACRRRPVRYAGLEATCRNSNLGKCH